MVRKIGGIFKWVYLALTLIFLYAPIAVLIIFSFTDSKTMSKWNGFTLSAYRDMFNDAALMQALKVTLIVAIVSSIAATIIGTTAAIGINSMKRRRRLAIENISQLPMINPDLVTGISLMMLFSVVGLSSKLGYLRLILAHTTFNIPYVMFSVLPKLRQSSNLLYEAALDLGCKPTQALWKVVLPDIMPGVISGFIMAFTLSIDDFVISWFVADGVQNLSIYIYGLAKRGISTKINAFSALMFVVVVTLLLIVNIRSMRQDKIDAAQRKKVAKTN
ncbi:MAG: ABC transporter permease [Christensenellales bacterium]|nr:ABC transporter permease [Eubacteriales bacterium]